LLPVASDFEVQRLAVKVQPALGELELYSGVNGPKVLVNRAASI
jgi:hypothetical protein